MNSRSLESTTYEASGHKQEHNENTSCHTYVNEKHKHREYNEFNGHCFLSTDQLNYNHCDEEARKLSDCCVEQINIVLSL